MFGRLSLSALLVASLVATTAASAATYVFNTDPFVGSAALTTPGRQIVGGEPSISFDVAGDQFVFDPAFFDVGSTVTFANDIAGNLSTSGLNVIVLQTFDNDADANTPFGAGNAANLLAGQITTDGAGFFIYFNSGLNLPRLVYSTNLNEPDADLKILARLGNLTGNSAALAGFSASNFSFAAQPVPEPASWLMMIAGFGVIGFATRRRKQGVRIAPLS